MNEKREEMNLSKISHDLNLDKISRRFNEIRLSQEDLTEEEIQNTVHAEFQLNNKDINMKGKDRRENYKIIVYQGK